jgi:hypothetical protein
MRNFATVLVVAVGTGILSLPIAWAQDESQQPAAPQVAPRQHQDVIPPPGDSTTRRDQSAETSQPPGVIAPPATGDHSVITPPATGAAKTPVIPPPGTPGGNNDVEPK